IGAWTLGSLGEVALTVDLGASLEVRVDRRRAIVRPGGGLWVRGTELPATRLRALTLGLGPVHLEVDADGLGALPGAAIGALVSAAARHRYGATPSGSRTLADLWLAGFPTTARGLRAVATLGSATVAIDPAAEVRAAVDRDKLEVASSRPIEVTVSGLRLRA